METTLKAIRKMTVMELSTLMLLDNGPRTRTAAPSALGRGELSMGAERVQRPFHKLTKDTEKLSQTIYDTINVGRGEEFREELLTCIDAGDLLSELATLIQEAGAAIRSIHEAQKGGAV